MSMSLIQSMVRAAASLVIVFGFVVAMAAHPATNGVASFFADLLFWPVDGAPVLDAPAARLLAGIGGGVMVGWGVTLWLLAARLFPIDPAAAGSIIKASVLAWFAVDSVASIAAGAPLNAVLNLAFLVAFLWPLSRMEAEAGGTIGPTAR